MESLKFVDISNLDEKCVILVQTTNGKEYKIIPFKSIDRRNMANVLLSHEEKDSESEREEAIITRIQVGRPISIIIPENNNTDEGQNMRSSQTAIVTTIELYT